MVVVVVLVVVGGGRDETENEVGFFCTIMLQPQKVFIVETNGPIKMQELRESVNFREGFYAEGH